MICCQVCDCRIPSDLELPDKNIHRECETWCTVLRQLFTEVIPGDALSWPCLVCGLELRMCDGDIHTMCGEFLKECKEKYCD